MSQQNYIIYLKTLSELERKEEINDKISQTRQEILDTDEASSVLAETNATWYVEEAEIQDDDIDVDEDECTVTVNYKASGEQDEEKGFWGNEITGTAEAVIDEYGKVKYQNVTADIVGIDVDEEDNDTDEEDNDTDEENLTEDEDEYNDEENKDFINDNDTVEEGEIF